MFAVLFTRQEPNQLPLSELSTLGEFDTGIPKVASSICWCSFLPAFCTMFIGFFGQAETHSSW